MFHGPVTVARSWTSQRVKFLVRKGFHQIIETNIGPFQRNESTKFHLDVTAEQGTSYEKRLRNVSDMIKRFYKTTTGRDVVLVPQEVINLLTGSNVT